MGTLLDKFRSAKAAASTGEPVAGVAECQSRQDMDTTLTIPAVTDVESLALTSPVSAGDAIPAADDVPVVETETGVSDDSGASVDGGSPDCPECFYQDSRDVAPDGVILAVGQRVYSILYGGRYGVVYAIDGEQSPGSVRSIGGVAQTGGSAHYSIVFDDGSESRGLPECILRGVQWRVFQSVASEDEIAACRQYAAAVQAEKKRRQEAAENRRATEREQHKRDNPHLLRAIDQPNWSPGRIAAENIRRELKRRFQSVKFRVKSDHNSVDVYWSDGPTSDQIQTVTNRHRAGHFDGMDDSYKYNSDATFADVFGSPRYVSTHRGDTLYGVREAWRRAGRDPSDVPEEWGDGGRWNLPQSLGDAIFRTWSESDLSAGEVTPDQPAEPVPAAVAGITVTYNADKSGLEIRFPAKPDQKVIASLKADGWRWSRHSSCWWRKDSTPARVSAWSITGVSVSGAPELKGA